ncbi:FG-GAP repeat protein [Sphingobacterium paucimobilis]|nr:FG-GAP repeat protein [Sphingobacterium paucimobilis]
MKEMKLTVYLFLLIGICSSGMVVHAQQLDEFLYDKVTYNLKRTPTAPISGTMKAYHPSEFISLATKGKASNVVIVKADKAENNHWGELLRTALSKAWKVDVPLVDWEEARLGNRHLILFGKPNYNMPLRELEANTLLGKNERGYELRTIPNALSWQKDVLYINGIDEADFKQAIQILLEKTSNPDKIKHFIACKGWAGENVEKDSKDFLKELEDHYAKDDSRRNNLAIQNNLEKAVYKYKMTGDERYAETFSKMMNYILDRYDEFVGPQKTPPTFEFHVFPAYMYHMENTKAFSDADRLKAIEFMRRIGEEAMDYWEMKEPMEFYQDGFQGYITNHSCFASRTVFSISRYLLSRYNYEPVRYWKEVADNGFDGVALNPYSPEDAAGYQYLVYRIFVDYALMSGRYKMDFFRAPLFQGYLQFAKAQYNHLGYMAGYGDAFAIGHYSSHPFLLQAIELFDDNEAKYLLELIERNKTGKGIETKINLPPPSPETHGMHYFVLNEFKKEQYKIKNYFKTPLLDKAIFRSGWDDKADFLTVTGINGDGRNHGHFDANGISQYIVGDRLWLWEGDYIKKFPDDHNSMVVNRDGKNFDFSRNFKVRNKSAASQVTAALQSKDKSQSLMSLLLEEYNGVNWTRNINYLAKKGLWVIDEVDVLLPGDYGIEIYWRSVGNMRTKDQGVQFTQRPSSDGIPYNFFVVEGSGANVFTKSFFDSGHGRKDGNISGYKKNFDVNTRQVVQRRQGQYQKGDKLYYVNFMMAEAGKNPQAPQVQQIDKNVFAAAARKEYHVAVMGQYKSGNIEIDADRCFMGPAGIIAAGAKTIRMGSYTWTSDTPKDFVLDYNEGLGEEYLGLLKSTFEKGSSASLAKVAAVDVPEVKAKKIKTLKSHVSAMAQQGKLVGIGTADGTFMVLDESGNTIAEHTFPKQITAITPIRTEAGTRWAVAVFPESRSAGKASLHLIDEEGAIAWTNSINSWHNRYGTITTMFTAQLDKTGVPAIIAGSQGWHYYAFAHQTGKQIFRAPITHGATVGAAGDMDGDGLDDIAAGAEYYYHQLTNHKGVPSERFSASPWNYSVVVKDLDGDGMKEAVFGRGDGWLYVNVPKGNKFKTWRANVGGRPIAIVDLEAGATKLATATEMGDVVYLDGSGKVLKYVKLPGQLTDLKVSNGILLASCIDGWVYTLNADGQVLGKSSYAHDPTSIYATKITVDSDMAAFFNGKDIYYLTDFKR